MGFNLLGLNKEFLSKLININDSVLKSLDLYCFNNLKDIIL